jgi:hypothetical protein
MRLPTAVIQRARSRHSSRTRRRCQVWQEPDYEHARVSCVSKSDYWVSQQCLAVTYDKLGRHADGEAVLAKMRAENSDAAAYQYATVYAQWGNTPKALEWLDTAMRLRDPGLVELETDPLMDPLRKEPRFQAVMRELKFPE